MPFVRVKYTDSAAPQHEFDISTDTVAAFPDKYTVVDPTEVGDVRPAKIVAKKAEKTATPKKPAARAASKKAPARASRASAKSAPAVGLIPVDGRELSVAEVASTEPPPAA